MIDFTLDDSGDIQFEQRNTITPLKINFQLKEYPVLKIDFKCRCRKPQYSSSGRIRLDFETENVTKERVVSTVKSLRDSDERSQEIMIRLKTELGEMEDYYTDFGSSISTMKHADLMLESNYRTIEELAYDALSDIDSNDLTVNVYRNQSSGNFQLENLDISVSDSGSASYTYSI